MEVKFVSSKDSDEEPELYLKINRVETMNYHKVDEVIQELFESLLNRCQIGLEISPREWFYILYVIK